MRSRALIAALLLSAILGVPVFAGAPQEIRANRTSNAAWFTVLTRTTNFASNAIDTVIIDTDKLQHFGNAGTGPNASVFFFVDNFAVTPGTGDSIAVAVDVGADGTDASKSSNTKWTTTNGIASFVLSGTAPTSQKIVLSSARYWRIRISNNQAATEAAIDYRLTIQGRTNVF